MGRHAAPDNPDDLVDPDEPQVASGTAGVQGDTGRHHDRAEGDSALPTTRAESGTRGDLRLLRERPALRARCAAAAIVPFLLFTAVLVVIGRTDSYLLWVWIPTVTAGVAIGGLLDAAHRHDR